MNEGDQPKITSTSLTSYKTKLTSIRQFIPLVAEAKNMKTIKIMHSQKQCFNSIEGIQRFANTQILNLKCNSIVDMFPINKLQFLKEIDLSSNRLKSINGIQGCFQLEKITLSNNSIQNIEGLNSCTRLIYVDLANNLLEDEKQLKHCVKLDKLTEIFFEKKNATNPMCVKRRQKYLEALNNYIICQCKSIQKIDGKNPSEIIRSLSTKNVDINKSEQPSYEQQNQKSHSNTQNYTQNYGHSKYDDQMQIFFQRKEANKRKTLDYEALLNHKEDMIDDLRAKFAELQGNYALQFKQLVKKQAENQRIYGQMTELSRQIQSKDSKLSEAHKRTEKLLETITQCHKQLQTKSSTIESLNTNITNLRIECTEYKTLAKDYEKKLSELHHKTLSSAEQRAVRSEELKRQNKQLYEQNINMVNDINSLKERVRELTELLRQWENKYQSKIRNLKGEYEDAHTTAEKQWDSRFRALADEHQKQIKDIDQDMRHKLASMEEEYQAALDETLLKYKTLRNQNEQKSHNEKQLKNSMRELLQKNKQNQHLLQQMQLALRRLKGQYQQQLKERQRLIRQNQGLRMNKDDNVRKISDQLSKANYERHSLQKIITNLKQNMSNLQSDYQRLNAKEKQWEDKEAQFEDLQARVKSQQAMLEDKNETIEELKQQIQNLKHKDQNEVIEAEKKYDQLRKKYDSLKQKFSQMQTHANEILEENEQLKQRDNQLESRQKQLSKISAELDEFNKIIEAQGKQIEQKQKRQEQLLAFIQDIRNQQSNRLRQIEQMRREVERSQIQLSQKQRKWRKEKSEIEREFNDKIAKIEQQNENNKIAMKKKLEVLSKQFFNL